METREQNEDERFYNIIYNSAVILYKTFLALFCYLRTTVRTFVLNMMQSLLVYLKKKKLSFNDKCRLGMTIGCKMHN